MDYDFEQFFDDSLDMLCIAGTDGYFKRLNPSFERILGWSTEHLLGQPFVDFIHPEDVEATLGEVGRLAEGLPTIAFENRYRCANGTYRYLRWTAHPDPETGMLYAIARDETELRAARDRFRIALEASPTAMIMADEEGRIVMVNHAAAELFGYGNDELLGEPIEVLVPESYRQGHPSLRAGFAGEGARPMGVGRDLAARRSSGSEFPVEIGLNPIRTEEGDFVLAAVIDLTERVRAAKELERSNRELEHFASVASHDLQEPLRMVAGYMRLLDQRHGEQLDAAARQYVRYAVDGTARMQDLIEGLLTYARVQRGPGGLEPVALDEAVQWAVSNLQAAIADSGASLSIDSLPVVDGDATQLGQLFQNLIGNAIKFRSETPLRIEISAVRQDGEWLLAVTDNGIGIDGESRERVFEIFQRLHDREDYEGTGIGLAVCRRIVERHGGLIWLEPAPGGGTKVCFTLPCGAAG